MRPKLFILFLLISSISFSQQSYTSDQIHRLADAGKVWGYLKYYHPYLQYKEINWDSAFIATAPEILKAKNKQEFEKCLEKLLNFLNDPVTAVIHKPETSKEIKFSDLTISDSIMVITHYDDRVIDHEDNSKKLLNKATAQLKNVNAVIFDLRPDKETFMLNDGPLIFQTPFGETQVLSNLFNGTVSLPSIRTVLSKTFISETSENNSSYQSPFSIERRNSFIGRGNRNIPMIFIINKYSNLPIEALGLQLAGKAVIIQEESSGEIGIVPDVKFQIYDSVLLRARLGELIHSDNGLGFYPNIIISKSENRDIAIEKAKEVLKIGAQPYQSPLKDFRGFASNINSKSLTKNPFPSIGERALAIAKIYSVLKYFYPNKNLWTHNWDSIYLQFLPQFLSAQDSIEYTRVVVEMYTYLQDGHGVILQNSIPTSFRNATGVLPPFQIRIVENELVITDIINDSLCKELGIQRGDIIIEKDGKNSISDVNETRKYFSASNYDAQSGQIASRYLRNPAGTTVKLKLRDAQGKIKNALLRYVTPSRNENRIINEFNEKGNKKPVMYFVSKDIGYANLGALKPDEVDSMFNMFKNTKAIIFDVRPYPRTGAIYRIAPRLGLKYGGGMKNLPGKDLDDFRDNKIRGWIYNGKTVCLMYENTQSAGETVVGILYKSTLIGNHTAGANGGVVNFFIPGNIRLSFTGSAVKGQGAGIQPHILVTPTIKGIHQGKDEILERAIKFIETGK